MRYGDFGLEVVPRGPGDVRETDGGLVLARPGQVYAIRLRNFGPLHCVVQVALDGLPMTGGGLVLRPFSVTELERPVDKSESGRFTVVAEGNERVFGPDGGRDNPDLGLVRAAFRRELPRAQHDYPSLPPSILHVTDDRPQPAPARPRFTPPSWNAINRIDEPRPLREPTTHDVERAAGTGLTGKSDQQFAPASLGALESEETVLSLRIVIGSEAAIASAAPSDSRQDVPARPEARP